MYLSYWVSYDPLNFVCVWCKYEVPIVMCVWIQIPRASWRQLGFSPLPRLILGRASQHLLCVCQHTRLQPESSRLLRRPSPHSGSGITGTRDCLWLYVGPGALVSGVLGFVLQVLCLLGIAQAPYELIILLNSAGTVAMSKLSSWH